jgi:acyl dehydratase
MPIVTKAIGARMRAFETEVSRRRILAFSAAIGAMSDRHFDDTRGDDLVAFPTLCTMFEHALLSNGFEDGVNPTNASLEEMRRGVQATQDTEFHRPIQPRQHVRTSGRIVAIKPTPAGCLMHVGIELNDTRTQQRLATSWISIVFLHTGTIGAPAEIAGPPPMPTCAEPTTDANAQRLVFAPTFPHVYSECANIWNPIHTERRAATAAGLPHPIVHGSAIWSLALVAIVDSHCEGDGTRVKRATATFRGMVFPGTEAALCSHRIGNWVAYAVRGTSDETTVSGMVELA